jgi:ABC-type amino acid transport substrate-binding protein
VAVRGWDDVRKLGPDGTVLLIHGDGMLEKMQKIDGLRFDAHARDARSNYFHMVIAKSVGPEVRVKVQCAIAYLARSGEPARLFRKWGDA